MFELCCQPIIDFSSDLASQWELLLRLPGDGDQLILPAQFLYTAERSGLNSPVDLHVVERDVLEVVEGAEPVAEIVKREAAAKRLQLGGEPASAIQVGDGGGLDDLQDEIRRIDSRLLASRLDQLEQLWVADRATGDIRGLQ